MTEHLFLAGGGVMAAKIASFDWAGTPLGPISGWPQSLKTSVSLILNSKFPTYMVWGPGLTGFYNDAYTPALGNKPEALGRPFCEVWSEIWDEVGPIADKAMAGEASYFENLPLTMERKGHAEETWWTFSYSPIRDESGGVGGVLCTVHETTGEFLAHRALVTQQEQLADWFRQAPGLICILSGPEHRFELVNDSYAQVTGRSDLVGKTVAEAFPEVVDQGFIALLDRVYTSDEAYIGSAVPLEIERAEGRTRVFIDFIYQPIRDSAGHVTGIFVEGSDVTERTVAAERQRLLVNELNHRVKNSLATVQSIVTQTLRNTADVTQARKALENRIFSLARAHDLLTQECWSGASLEEVVGRALQPFLMGSASQFSLEGDPVRVSPSQALLLSLALHELATNAAKYGALSVPGGAVEVRWTCEPLDDGHLARLSWRERGGPPVTPPARRGFGTRLLTRGFEGETGASARLTYEPGGVVFEVAMPVGRETAADVHGLSLSLAG
jgi:two-component sensor histidine kinase/PAS domain-containing protein